MKKSTRYFTRRCCLSYWAACLLSLLGLPHLSLAQVANRVLPPNNTPTQLLCSPTYGQQPGATYVAANHLSGSFGPADIGTTGVTTTIDAGLFYGGTVVFSGSYHVRGIVRFINGTFDLRPGTVFYAEGLSGQSTPNPPFSPTAIYTTLEVENANLELTGATLLSVCTDAWGGVRLAEQGRIRTRADAAVTAPAGRCVIQDALVGVEVREPVVYGNYATAEYYLNATDFVNNGIGLSDRHTYVARAGTGAHYCGFRTDAATLKAPLKTPGYTQLVGAQFWVWDMPLGTNNYAAASIDHCSFHHLSIGIYGAAQELRIADNTFDYIRSSAIDLSFGDGGTGLFSLTPMYVERNNILMRGADPQGQPTTYGIYGGVYARDNYIHGDDANPAANNVEQVGIYMIGPDNSTQTRNTFERLDKGIEVGVDGRGLTELDISGNMFRDVVQGISFFTYYTRAMSANRLHVRCNSFENPANLVGAVALNVEGPDFPSALGDAANGNGNRFVTPGLPGIEPISNPSALVFTYWYFGASLQEDLSQAAPNQTYSILPTGGNPATACTDAGYVNGINNRTVAGSPIVGNTELRQAVDSLRLAIPANRQQALLATLIAATIQRQGYADLETYLTGLPDVAQAVHTALGGWLLHYYREEAHDEPGAQRVRTALLARHPADPEVSSSVRLSDALMHLAQRAHPLSPPAPAALAALRAVAASGTAAARVACRIARRYEPACPCRLPAQKAAQGLAQRSNSLDGKRVSLGVPYPNPAGEWTRIPYSLPTDEANSARLEVRNTLGQLVWSALVPPRSGEAKIEVSQVPTGLYQVALVVNKQTSATQRFAVTH